MLSKTFTYNTMASSIVEEIDEKFLKCGICLDNFRSPRGLPCLHSFCEECLEGWAKKTKTSGVLTCPSCMKELSIPKEGVRGFPANFLVNSLQETIDMEKKIDKNVTGICNKMTTSILETSDDKRLKCAICLDYLRSPRTLSCFHSFCKECVEEWAEKSEKRGVLNCPICMKETPLLEEGDKWFPAHLAFLVQESGDMEKKGVKGNDSVCSNCNILGNRASFCCLDCQEFMCDTCHSSHKQIKSLKDHRVLAMEDQHTGKVTKLVDRTQERYCEKHDGEQKRFYCETCDEFVCRDCIVMKQCCRDHVYRTLHKARQSERDRNLNESREIHQTAIPESKKSENNPVKSINTTIHQNAISGRYEDEDNSIHVCRSSELRVPLLAEKESQARRPEVSSRHLPSVAKGKQWELVREIDTQMGIPYGITFISRNEIALRYAFRVIITSRSGKSKYVFGAPYGFNIAFTHNGKYVVTGHNENKCHIYDIQGKEISSFPCCDFNNDPSTPWPVAMDNEGNIVVGSVATVSVHKNTGTLVSRFQTEGDPCGLCVTSNGKITVVYFNSPWFQVIEPSGNVLVTPDPPLEVKEWKPRAVCCSSRDELFVTNDGDPTGVYMYTSNGVYLQCITSFVGKSRGIALTQDDQELFVTDYDDKVLKVFRRT